MKVAEEMICFQEIPDETSLSFSISNCPYNCKGCHSPYLAKDIGTPIEHILENRLNKYKDLVTCVLFMGGDDSAQIDTLVDCLKLCKEKGFKTALYSGADSSNSKVEQYLDYYKIGRYIEQFGGLPKKTTNQRLLKKEKDVWNDITFRFWEKPYDIGEV